jgi:hypothetical protein
MTPRMRANSGSVRLEIGREWDSPDRDLLLKTEDISEAKRIASILEKHLIERMPADAADAKHLREHLIGLAALLDEASHRVEAS